MFYRTRWAALAVLAAIGMGCNGATLPEGARPTYPTKAIVTYKGAPVEGATVTFISDDAGGSSFGMTDAQGVATMKTSYAEGSVEGPHKVTISKMETVGGAPQVDQESPEYDPNSADVPGVVKDHLPAKYSNPMTSGFTADVTTSGPNEFKFDLTD